MAHAAHIRDGFHTVTPYLTVDDASGLIDFLRQVFAAEEVRRDHHPDGSIMNAELRIGDSIVELSQASARWAATPAALHIYVPDTDAAYDRALQAGAATLYEPADMPYAERSAGVRDPFGNTWFIATFQPERRAEEAVPAGA
jgi:PhnB protein